MGVMPSRLLGRSDRASSEDVVAKSLPRFHRRSSTTGRLSPECIPSPHCHGPDYSPRSYCESHDQGAKGLRCRFAGKLVCAHSNPSPPGDPGRHAYRRRAACSNSIGSQGDATRSVGCVASPLGDAGPARGVSAKGEWFREWADGLRGRARGGGSKCSAGARPIRRRKSDSCGHCCSAGAARTHATLFTRPKRSLPVLCTSDGRRARPRQVRAAKPGGSVRAAAHGAQHRRAHQAGQRRRGRGSARVALQARAGSHVSELRPARRPRRVRRTAALQARPRDALRELPAARLGCGWH